MLHSIGHILNWVWYVDEVYPHNSNMLIFSKLNRFMQQDTSLRKSAHRLSYPSPQTLDL